MIITPAELSISIPSRTCPACGGTAKTRGHLLCWACATRLPPRLRALLYRRQRAFEGISPALASWLMEQIGATEYRLPESSAMAGAGADAHEPD